MRTPSRIARTFGWSASLDQGHPCSADIRIVQWAGSSHDAIRRGLRWRRLSWGRWQQPRKTRQGLASTISSLPARNGPASAPTGLSIMVPPRKSPTSRHAFISGCDQAGTCLPLRRNPSRQVGQAPAPGTSRWRRGGPTRKVRSGRPKTIGRTRGVAVAAAAEVNERPVVDRRPLPQQGVCRPCARGAKTNMGLMDAFCDEVESSHCHQWTERVFVAGVSVRNCSQGTPSRIGRTACVQWPAPPRCPDLRMRAQSSR
jgi:hypothetical protein